MRLVLNLIWLIFGGLVMAFGYAVVALVMFILIITIPFGIASARIALFCLWPFGRTVVRRPDAGAGSLVGNVIWFILAGWWLAIGHLVTGVLMCLTIIGIPLGLANFKLIPVSLTPLGRDIVDIDQAQRLGYDSQVSCPPTRRARAPDGLGRVAPIVSEHVHSEAATAEAPAAAAAATARKVTYGMLCFDVRLP